MKIFDYAFYLLYNLYLNKEDGLQEVQVEVYPQDNRDNGAKTVSYGRPVEDAQRENVGVANG